jgi:hypothetical protein
MKKEIIETRKLISPNVSSRGYGRKCVNGMGNVQGCISEFRTMYIHPRRPKMNNV